MCDKIDNTGLDDYYNGVFDSVSGTTAAILIPSSFPSTSNFIKTYQNRYVESYSWSEALFSVPYKGH